MSEQWDTECYAYVKPTTYADQLDLTKRDMANASSDDQIAYQLQFVRDHFVSGKVRVFNGKSFDLVNMTEDDCTASIEICDRLYAEINGFDVDPKGIRKEALDAALQKTKQPNTETSSLEESPTESPSAPSSK